MPADGRALFPETAFWAWTFGIVLALLFAYLSYAYWSVMIAISGAVLGFTLGVSLFQMIGFWDWIAVLAGLALAVVFGLLYFRFRDLFVMVSTGLTGAALVLYGIRLLHPLVLVPQGSGNLVHLPPDAGAWRGGRYADADFSGMSYYSEEQYRTPPPILITRDKPDVAWPTCQSRRQRGASDWTFPLTIQCWCFAYSFCAAFSRRRSASCSLSHTLASA